MRRGHHEGNTDTHCEPCGKTLYANRKRAEQVAGRQKLRFYPCPVEGGSGFHLGHKAQSGRDRGPGSNRDVFTGTMDELAALAAQMRG